MGSYKISYVCNGYFRCKKSPNSRNPISAEESRDEDYVIIKKTSFGMDLLHFADQLSGMEDSMTEGKEPTATTTIRQMISSDQTRPPNSPNQSHALTDQLMPSAVELELVQEVNRLK